MGKHDGNNIIAIGAATMGLSSAAIIICLCMFYGSIYMDTGFALALIIILLFLTFFAGSVVLIVGIVIKIIRTDKKETVKEKPLIVNEKETKPAEKFEKPKDTSGMIKCPYCGKEQQKNSFGCIFCHAKF